MISDCHLHTSFSDDSTTPVEFQVEKAISLGMEHICITDHMDMDYPGGEFLLDTDRYVEKILDIREKYKDKIDISMGVELGLQEHLQERLSRYIEKYPFDFVIGSMHLIHGEDPYYQEIFKRTGDEQAYREYFQQTLKNLYTAPDIDTLGHLDYVVRYGPDTPAGYPDHRFDEIIDEILRTIIGKEIALECNTAGLKYELGFPNPHGSVIRRYLELGGEMITLGSDSHRTEHLGYAFTDIGAFLKDCGVKYQTVFVNRKPEFIPL